MRRDNTHTTTQACNSPIRFGALAALLMTTCGWAAASGPAPSASYQIEQPAQPLSDALLAIARQTGASILFVPAAVRGLNAQPVYGQMSAEEAIARVLLGSGLILEQNKGGALVVRTAPAPSGSARAISAALSATSSNGLPPSSSDGTPLLLAQAAPQGTSDAGGAVPQQGRAAGQESERIEVTGTRLKRVASEGPLPVNTYTKADIDRSGQPTLERFLSTLNEAPMSPGEGATGITSGQGSVQLRGLPLGSTLVLLNGRRLQAVGSSAGNYFNLNLIPLAAVERVEVLPVGSSAVYGGDALAGVVNIILKKSLDGYALSAGVTKGKSFRDRNLSLATGGADDAGSYILLGAYGKSTPLRMADRAFFLDADYRPQGGPDARGRNCTPGTVTSNTAANLPGLNSTFAAIPQGASGQPLAIANFSATAGQANLCTSWANGHGNALTYGSETLSLHASAERRVFGGIGVFGELTYVDDRLNAEETGLLLSNVLVPASNPYNPFGVAVRVTGRLGLDNGATGIDRKTRFVRALGGFRGDLGPRWDYEVLLSTSRDDGRRLLLNDITNTAARTAALAASSPAAALNPFTTGRAASDDVVRGIWSYSVRENHGKKDQAAAFVRGQAFELPAGAVDVIAGAEWAGDRFDVVTNGVDRDTKRTSNAMFGEARVPLLRGGNGGSGDGKQGGKPWNLATLTLAGRRDDYSDFGSANTYQGGLELRPSPTLLLRAAAATSFKPPTLPQTNITDQTILIGTSGLVDPARGREPITSGESLRTTNRNLGPERGKAHALGALWEPDAWTGTRLGLTAWQVKIDGVITLLNPQVLLNNEALFPGYVTRQPTVDGVPGRVTRLIYTEVNFGRVETAGVDFEASQSWKATGGTWTGSVQATRTTKYEVAIAPGGAVEDRAGRRALDYWAPSWKGRLSAGFEQGVWGLGVTSRYLGSYKDTGTSDRRLGDFWVHDLSGRLDLKKAGLGLSAVKSATVSLAIVNVANRLPQFVGTALYYDATQADWRGRYASMRLAVDW